MSAPVSFIRTLAAGAIRVAIVFTAYQVYSKPQYGPGVPFREYTNRLLDYKTYSREDISKWRSENYSRENLLDPDIGRMKLAQLYVEECHLNWFLVGGSMVLGVLAGRQILDIHIRRFIRGRQNCWTIKYWKTDGVKKDHGTRNQVYSSSELPYLCPWESYGYVRNVSFRVPMHIYLQELVVDVRHVIDMDDNALIPDIMIQGEISVNIMHPSKAASILLNVDDEVEMGRKVEEFIRDYVLARIRENVVLVKYMHDDPDEYLRYLNKFVKQLLLQKAGLEVVGSEIFISRQNDNEPEFDYDEDEEHKQQV